MHRPFSFGKLYTARRKPGAGAWRCKKGEEGNMITFSLLLFVGLKIAAPSWYYIVLAAGFTIKIIQFGINVAKVSMKDE